MITDLLLEAGTAIACGIVVLRTEPAINHMHGGTDFWVRLSFWQMWCACGVELLTIGLYQHTPDWREALLSGGLAALLLCERRLRYLSRGLSRRVRT